MTENLQADVLRVSTAQKKKIDMDVFVHESIGSTNDWSLKRCGTNQSLPFACFAERQTDGRGRRGKRWLMKANTNIAMSICWYYDLSQLSLHLLPLSIALAVADTLETMKLQRVQIKWPNDVYVGGGKIAGILIETCPLKNDQSVERSKAPMRSAKKYSTAAQPTAVVIGIGLNVDMPEPEVSSSEMPLTAVPITDIRRELIRQLGANCQLPDRGSVAATLLQNVVASCQNFPHDTRRILDDFRLRYDYCKDRLVDIHLENDTVLSGIARGVSDAAELVVEIDGEIRQFNSAEVSVRPVER